MQSGEKLTIANEIKDEADCDGGWEWFACYTLNQIARFDNGGLREPPRSVKGDKESAERLSDCFLKELHDHCQYSLREGVEQEFGGWNKVLDVDEFLNFYGGNARKGLFTYNTQLIYGREAAEVAKQLGVFSETTKQNYDLEGRAGYYLVAIPERPIHLNDLPPEIARLVSRTRSPLNFEVSTHFLESDTLPW